MLTSYSTLLKVSDRDIQNLNDQHPDRCQIKQAECILFGQKKLLFMASQINFNIPN